jgi:hypothetical protein
MDDRRSRGWVFTLNNYTDEQYQTIWEQSEPYATYIIIGKEVGASGTPHLQGYLEMRNAKTMRAVKNLLATPQIHLEPRRGTVKQAADYCKKDGSFQERGTLPTSANAGTNDWAEVIRLAEIGDLQTLKANYPRHYLTYYRTIMCIRAHNCHILNELTNEWWHGPTGTGKSRKAWTDFPEHFAKPVNKWWDGYSGEEVVVIEEWQPDNSMTAAKLKVWADRYPFPAEVKGGTIKQIRPAKLIVTSNYTIDQCFPKSADAEPLKRRFREVLFPIRAFFPVFDVPEVPLEPIDIVEGDQGFGEEVDFEELFPNNELN